MTQACEDLNSKLDEVVTDAQVDAEKRVDKSLVLVQIWKLQFGQKTKELVMLAKEVTLKAEVNPQVGCVQFLGRKQLCLF